MASSMAMVLHTFLRTKQEETMIKKRLFRKTLSVGVVFCFVSLVQFSQARAMQQWEKPFRCASDNPAIKALAKHLVGLDFCNNGICLSEEALENMDATAYDWLGLIVTYHLLLFIYYGRVCLETLDPSACGSMVNHLVIAIVLGTILESF